MQIAICDDEVSMVQILEKKIKKPGKTEMLDLNKSGLLDEERVLEIILNYNKEKKNK